MAHPRAITKHTVADNDTYLEIESEEGLVPVAIYAVAWTPTSFTLALPTTGSGLPGDPSATFKETDDAAVTLVDDKWSTIPEAMGRKTAAAGIFRLIYQATETGGPFTAQIAWAPLGGA